MRHVGLAEADAADIELHGLGRLAGLGEHKAARREDDADVRVLVGVQARVENAGRERHVAYAHVRIRMMEAVRILKAVGLRPRRTVRIALRRLSVRAPSRLED